MNTMLAASRDRTFTELVAALASAQKPAKGAPAYSRFINRRLGRYLAAMAFKLGLSPNMVTGLSGSCSFLGIAILMLARPTALSGVLIAAALMLGYALDSADGQLARLQGGGSPSGEWLDHMVDAAKITSLHLAVLVSCFRFFDFTSPDWLLIPLGFTLVANVAFFSMILNEQLRRGSATAVAPPAVGKPSTLRSLLVIPTDYGVLCVAFVLLGSTHAFFAVYTVLFVGSATYLLLALVKWFGDMRGLDG